MASQLCNASDPLSRYISSIEAIPSMSREKEQELARAARSGDRKAGERIVRANLRHVVAIARSLNGYDVPLDELIAEGSLGLLHAMRKFDPDKDIRFVTYAAYWVRCYMLNRVMRDWTVVKGGGVMRSQYFFSFRRERAAALHKANGDRDVAMEMLAKRYNRSIDAIRRMDAIMSSRDLSLDTTPSSGDAADPNAPMMIDSLPSNDPSPRDMFEAKRREILVSTNVLRALVRLDPRERTIVEQNIMADEPKSLAEIGRRFGISRERTRQIQVLAKSKLREVLEQDE